MALTRIQLPDNVIRITPRGSRGTIFTTKKDEERIRLEREDRKEKLEIRSQRREEARPEFHKELEMSEGAVRLGDFLLGELAVQENTTKGLLERASSSNDKANNKRGDMNLEKTKYETIEALKTLM
jgi:hypothetical protein